MATYEEKHTRVTPWNNRQPEPWTKCTDLTYFFITKSAIKYLCVSLSKTRITFWKSHKIFEHNELIISPYKFRDKQCKWICRAHCIIRIHTTYSPKFIRQCERPIFNHTGCNLERSSSKKPKIFIYQTYFGVCVTGSRWGGKCIKIPYS